MAADSRPIDPTANVIAAVADSSQRQDDLRKAFEQLVASEIAHLKEIIELHAKHQRELDHAESARIDSIRQVDREEVSKTTLQALTAVQTLAATTSTTAETLRLQVATTAQAQSTQLATLSAEFNKRLSALELSISGGAGGVAAIDKARSQSNWQTTAITAVIAIVASAAVGIIIALVR